MGASDPGRKAQHQSHGLASIYGTEIARGTEKAETMKPVVFVTIVLALLCSSCYGTRCVSKCGVQLVNSTWSCDEFQAIEDRVVNEYRKRSLDSRTHSCEKLKDWTVWQDDKRTFYWIGDGKREVRGETVCEMKIMHINYESPHRSSYAHEMGHALQNCEPRIECLLDAPIPASTDLSHACWEHDGINDAWRVIEIWEQFP